MDMKRFFLYAIMIAALALAGCGGNGGMAMGPGNGNGNGNGNGDQCPSGQTGTPPNCVTPPPPTCLEDPMAADCTGPTQAEVTAAAMTKDTAIVNESMQGGEATTPGTDGEGGPDAGLGGSSVTVTGNSEGAYNLAIKRERDMPAMVTVTVEGPTDAADENFMLAMDLGGGTSMHVRTMDADAEGNVVEEVAIVTTDIAAPTAVPFAMVTNQTLDARDLDPGTDADGDGTATNDFTALTVSGDTQDDAGAAVRALVMSDSFVPGPANTTLLTFNFDSTGTTEDEADEVMGTYNGAMGTYRCNGTANCTVTLDDEGMITAMSTGWVFTPAPGATSDVSDDDYLHYGFWLKNTTDKDGKLTYNEVETFAGASIPTSGAVNAVTGTATYNGGATGVYVKNVVDSTGTVESSTSGHFTADATLTASFGGDDVAINDQFKLNGMIERFILSGGEANNWTAVLAGDITQTEGTAMGTAKGGSPFNDGSFDAIFHGSTDDGDGNPTAQPSSVVGEFNSFFTDGSVAGAFGARR